VGPRNHVLDGGPDPLGEETIWEGIYPPTVKYKEYPAPARTKVIRCVAAAMRPFALSTVIVVVINVISRKKIRPH